MPLPDIISVVKKEQADQDRESRDTELSTDKILPLTPLATYILVALADGPKHGYAIWERIGELTSEQKPRFGSLYKSLHANAEFGLLEITQTEPRIGGRGPLRSGDYKLTDLGKKTLKAELERIKKMEKLINAVLKENIIS